MNKKLTDFEQDLQNALKNPESKKLFEEYGKQFEIAYAINALRKQKKISQATLAKKIGTTQSNIARIEAGNQNLTTSMLLKIARAFDKDLQIRFV